MEKRRLIKNSVLFVLVYILIMPLISAYSFSGYGGLDLRQGADQVINTAIDFASPFFEVIVGDYSGSEFFLAKCLLLIILYLVISFVLSSTRLAGLDQNRAALFIVSLAISILSIRYIPENDVISAMILPYSTMGVAISVIFPFIIFALFLHKSEIGMIGRRFGWITYIIIFLVLWNARSYELSPLGNQIYGWLLAASILMLIFDKQIHNYIGLAELQKINRDRALVDAAHYEEQAKKLEALGTRDAIEAAKRKRKEIEKILSK